MGSINTIWNLKNWKIIMEYPSKLIKDDIIYKVVIGDGEDYQYYEITEFISKDNFDNLISGNYFVKCFPYSILPILLFNDKQELIPLVRGSEVDYSKLSREQNEYIMNLNSKTLKLKIK